MQLSELAAIYAAYKATEILKVTSPDDVMWHSGGEWYFQIGESGVECVLNGLRGSWLGGVNRILDLPCGHGRVARHLRAAFPAAELVCCDLDTEAVDFCVEHLGATGLYSKPELSQVDLPTDIDVVWVGSLFTHVDAERTTRWMKKLAEHLSPHGIIVATFHGLWSLSDHARRPLINDLSWRAIFAQFLERGYGYAPYTEYDLGDYGISISDPSWIMKMATGIPGVRVVSYVERGWANNHDVLAITRNDRLAVQV